MAPPPPSSPYPSTHSTQQRSGLFSEPLGKDTWTPPWPPIWFHIPHFMRRRIRWHIPGLPDSTSHDEIHSLPIWRCGWVSSDSKFWEILSFPRHWVWCCLVSWKLVDFHLFGVFLTVATVDWACKATMKFGLEGFGVWSQEWSYLLSRGLQQIGWFWVFGMWKVNDSGNLECGSMCKFSSLGVWIILPLSSKHVMVSVEW